MIFKIVTYPFDAMNVTYPHPVQHKLPPTKITKGLLAFQKKMQMISNEQKQINKSWTKEEAQSSISSSSSSDDLIEKEFQEYQKVIHNPTKAIRDKYSLSKKFKKKVKKPPLEKKIVLKSNDNTSRTIQTSSLSDDPKKKSVILPEKSILSQNLYNVSIRIPNGHVSYLPPNSPFKLNILTQNAENNTEKLVSNFNSKSSYDPFNNNYIRSLDSNLKLNPDNPKLNITGQSLVGASISHVRPHKITSFEDKQYTSPTTRINWIHFRANPVKKPKPYVPPLSKEDQFLNHLMTKEGLQEAMRKNEALELLRKQKRENQKLIDFGNNPVAPAIGEMQTQHKTKTISKTMAINDY